MKITSTRRRLTMNLGKIFAAASPLLVVACAGAAPDPGAQSDASFRAAIANSSTSPFIVRIVLIDPDDGSDRVVCTEAPFLLGAIHHEFDLPYDTAGVARASEIALSAPSHSFRFTKPAARSNLAAGPRTQVRNAEACEAIEGGASVRRADLTDQLEFVR